MMANITLNLNSTETVCLDYALHFAWFCASFLISTVLLSVTLLTFACCLIYCCTQKPPQTRKKKQSCSGGLTLEESICGTTFGEAALEDRIIDIMALEEPGCMLQALNPLKVSSLVQAAAMVECARVQMLKGVFKALTSVMGVSKGKEGILDPLTHVNYMDENQQAWVNTQCGMEYHTVRQHMQAYTRVYEIGLQYVQRDSVLNRREEMHCIISEELEEAALTADKLTANHILKRYYACQGHLEAVLDLIIANQRAAINERHAQRQFLVQGLQDLYGSVCDVFSIFSKHINNMFTQIHREGVLSEQQCVEQMEHTQSDLLCVKNSSEKLLCQERSSIYSVIIKTRRERIAEMLCEQRREQEQLLCVSTEVQLDEYLQNWQMLLCAHNTNLSELLTHLDQKAATQIQKVLMNVLDEAVVELRQLECTLCESLQKTGVPPKHLVQKGSLVERALAEAEAKLAVREREAAKALRVTRGRFQPARALELQQQKELRERICSYSRSVCGGQGALSERDLLQVKLECVKSSCRLDRCLVPPQSMASQAIQNSENSSGSTYEPTSVNTHANMVNSQVCMNEDEVRMREFQKRVAMYIASLQWEKAERRNRVLDTYSALLTLQTSLLQSLQHTHAPAGHELSHTIHTHSLALQEVELQLQEEESQWAELISGHGYVKLLTPDLANKLFRVDTNCSITECLQEALCKRQQLAHILSKRLETTFRKQQVMEDQREQHKLKTLYTHCDQELLLTAVLVKLCGISVPLLQQLLQLLLPSVHQGELQSIMNTLASNEGSLGNCSDLVDKIRHEIINTNKTLSSYMQTERMQRRKQKLQDRLFFKSFPDDFTCPQPTMTAPTTKVENASAMVGGSTSEGAEDVDKTAAGESAVLAQGERLFTVCRTPTENEKHTLNTNPVESSFASDTSHDSQGHNKRKRFRFKKGTVAPLD